MNDAAWDFEGAVYNLSPAFYNGGPHGWIQWPKGYPAVGLLTTEQLSEIVRLAQDVVETGTKYLEARGV